MLQPGQYNVSNDGSQSGGSFTSLTDLLNSYGSQSYDTSTTGAKNYGSNSLLNPGFSKQYGYDGGASTSLDQVLSSNVLSTNGSSAIGDSSSSSSSGSGTKFSASPIGPSLYNPYLNRSKTSTDTPEDNSTQSEKDNSLVNILAGIGNQYSLRKSKRSTL